MHVTWSPFFLRLKKSAHWIGKKQDGFLVSLLNSSVTPYTRAQSRLKGLGTCLAGHFNSLQK